MEKSCAILSGGTYSPPAGIEEAELVIACDKGYAHAMRAGICPDLFVGDFDSLVGDVDANVSVLELPCEKDDTDTMAAVRYAVEHGYTRLRLYCALGGRLDHLLGNLQAAVFAVEHGARVEIVDDADGMHIFGGGSMVVPARDGYSLSLLSLTDECRGVTVRGVKYPLENATLTNAFPIGVSNEWCGDAEITLESGVLAVICSRMTRDTQDAQEVLP